MIITSKGTSELVHPDTSRVRELEAELKSLRDETRKLKEEKEDLQAQVINGGVNAGRMVLQNAASISIADELGSLSDNQVRNLLHNFEWFFTCVFCTHSDFPLVCFCTTFLHIFRISLIYPLLRNIRR